MFQSLIDRGFQVEFHAHAAAIIGTDFPEVVAELEPPLLEMSVPIAELIASGGGEAKATQRLRHALKDKGWDKQKFVVEKTINGVRRESTTHEMDHVRHYGHATIALEIEWNNKDPFFDRDLENFKRLHADGAISAGIIVTRGRSLHEALRDLVHGFVVWHQLDDIGQLASWGYLPTARQRREIERRATRTQDFRAAFADMFTQDKFGEATTHWRKLEDRVHRGVGNPCPLLLIGLPAGIVRPPERETRMLPGL